METNVNYTAVGIFIVTLLVALTLGIIWLSAGLSIQTYSTYAVYMQESVSGLSADGPIEYNGVEVGTVKSIKLNENDPHSVEILLNIQKGTPITNGTIATLNTRGLTGITYLALKDNGSDLKPLRAAKGERYPVIKTGPSLFLRIDTALNKLTSSLTQLSNAVQSVFDKENQRAIKEILMNVNKISRALGVNSDLIMHYSLGAMRTLDTETLPAANQTIANFNDVTDTLSAVSTELKQNPAILIRGKTPQALGPGEQ